MAGVSLKCGECGTLLKSVEEAQEHAENTKHSNFVESTEPVLNLVCSSCGKPCRSKTESDLHTKRTGHTEFADKTAETVKPISLEAPKPKIDDEDMEDAGEAVFCEENKMLAFPSCRVLPFTDLQSEVPVDISCMNNNMVYFRAENISIFIFFRNTSLSAANGLLNMKKLTCIDEMPMKEEEEKRMEREREKERIRVGRELLEAKRIEEENERKRIIALRKAEKEEEKRAREKILQKLAEDKAERRRKLGLPPEDPADAKPPAAVVEEKKSLLPVKPVTKLEQMRECLRGLKQSHKDDEAKVKKAFETLLTFARNVATNPNEEKFRKIRLTNATFQERVGKLQGGIEFLEHCGFEKIENGEFLYLPKEKVDMAVLNSAGSELTNAIKNPYFGIL
ncbi:hypothetical protein Leryth_019102 [Lithospermum erythrorhizon]|nr:hypothetical protein Leryth_019102 [Lithospermum erythrorhizon]